MSDDSILLPLAFASPSSSAIVINGRCQILEDGGDRVVMVGGVAVFRMDVGDGEAEDLFIAQAIENRYAKAGELARALGRSLRTVHHIHTQFVRRGAAGLAKGKRGPKGPRLGTIREAAIRGYHSDGVTPAETARRLGVSRSTVVAALRRMGLHVEGGAEQTEFEPDVVSGPALAAVGAVAGPSLAAEPATEPVVEPQPAPATGLPTTLDVDPADRCIDRMLAARGELEDAAPLFATGKSVPRAGALLAVPLLVASGVFDDADATFGGIGPAFYGLRTALLTLFLLALLRIKRPENLKEYSPQELGRILGLDRAPEVKTLRRKLSRIGDDGNCLIFLEKLVKRRIDAHSEALGFLYFDGHVRVYHGSVDLPRTHAARLRLSVPATQDVWINDADGSPVLVVTQEAHPSLTSVLRTMLTDIRATLGKRRVTVVFDRGGWSPQLFKWMEANGFDVLTYRKGDAAPVPEAEFTRYVVQLPRGIVVYELSDTIITLADGFQMRQVTRRQGAHQTNIVTTRRDLLVTEVAQRMFDRWRQENFFKYMREQYAIDALLEYGIEPADPKRDMPNPAWTKLEKARRMAAETLRRLEARYGAAVADDEERGAKNVERVAALAAQVRNARVLRARAVEERDKFPPRLPVLEVKGEAVRLPRGRKQLGDGLKMLAYQAETDLARLVAPYYKRNLDEGRRLIAAALQSAGDLEPADGVLHVTLAPQSSPHRTRAIAELCQLLTATNTHFPGTNLRLIYTVRDM